MTAVTLVEEKERPNPASLIRLPFDAVVHALSFGRWMDTLSLAQTCTHFRAPLYAVEAGDLWDKLVIDEAGGVEAWNSVFAQPLSKRSALDEVRSAPLRALYSAVRKYRSFIHVIPGEDVMSTTGPNDPSPWSVPCFTELGYRSTLKEFPASNIVRRDTEVANAINLHDICRHVVRGGRESICNVAQPLENGEAGHPRGSPHFLPVPEGCLLESALQILLEVSKQVPGIEQDVRLGEVPAEHNEVSVLAFTRRNGIGGPTGVSRRRETGHSQSHGRSQRCDQMARPKYGGRHQGGKNCHQTSRRTLCPRLHFDTHRRLSVRHGGSESLGEFSSNDPGDDV